jgi:hypothetical protein
MIVSPKNELFPIKREWTIHKPYLPIRTIRAKIALNNLNILNTYNILVFRETLQSVADRVKITFSLDLQKITPFQYVSSFRKSRRLRAVQLIHPSASINPDVFQQAQAAHPDFAEVARPDRPPAYSESSHYPRGARRSRPRGLK